jgi:hypothetical protein
LHLLFLHEASAQYLIDRRLHECRTDRFTLSVPLAEVRDELPVVADVDLECGQAGRQLSAAAECPRINAKSSRI